MKSKLIPGKEPGFTSIFYFKPKGFQLPSADKTTKFNDWLRKFIYNWSGFNKFGLYHDDLLFEYPAVEEAVRRLPEELREQRNWRILRAYQLSIERKILPKEEWTKWEEDIKFRYLTPYINEVLQEIRDRDKITTS